MAAFVVVARTGPSSIPRPGTRLNIFPGSATPAVFPAGAPFWIGYGFVPETADAPGGAQSGLHAETDFELVVDGQAASMHTDVTVDGGRILHKFTVADFPAGLPAGWHHFAGRWYDEGSLALTSDRSIEFVER